MRGPNINLLKDLAYSADAQLIPELQGHEAKYPVRREFLRATALRTDHLGMSFHRDEQLERKWRREEFEAQQVAGRKKGLAKIHEQQAKKREESKGW